MTEKELIDRLARMGPTDKQTDRMLERILNPAAKPRFALKQSYRIALPALVILLFSLYWLPALQQKQNKEIPQLTTVVAPFAAEFGLPRGGKSIHIGTLGKFLNYNGSRYTFLKNGAAYDLSGWKVEEQDALGTLQYDIAADIQNGGTKGYSSRDLATTYMNGGTIYALPGYAPAFRLAVSYEGRYYIAELSGKTDDRVIDAKEFVSLADLSRMTMRLEWLDHQGTTVMRVWDAKKDIRKWSNLIAESIPLEKLTDEQYERLAKARLSDRSCQARWVLRDGTSIVMYLVPDLSLLTIGNGNYELSKTFLETYSKEFLLTD
ncbi:hypothetical protein [Paenibacillus agaridevorans]|uniref:hypothetical protein n=1 Tax=Paenibacillus agaridevorans TaxID=171404 RepID=UPI001BE437E7|nr:hypothetical protein [Paenibacillus agaridevorans]